MTKQPSMAEIFSYVPNTINLVGFPRCKLLEGMGRFLGKQPAFREYGENANGNSVVYPSFPAEYLNQRRDFFKRLPKLREWERAITFPKKGDMGDVKSSLAAFCRKTYQSIEEAREYLKQYADMPEARNVLRKARVLDQEIRASLDALKDVEESRFFAVDSRTKVIVPLREMPKHGSCYRDGEETWDFEVSRMIDKARCKIGDLATRIAKRGVRNFRGRIMKFVDGQFRYSEDGFRRAFEDFAAPARLYAWYEHFLLEALSNMHPGQQDGTEEQKRYAEFGNHYEVRELFPPTLLGRGNWAVPINLETKRNERKILMAGLHSGSKSFHLSNLALLSVLAQTPLPIFAKQAVVPRFRKIFYYENETNKRGEGRAITELRDLGRIVEECGEHDALFIDELAGSMTEDIAAYIVPEVLARAEKVGTTLFVVSHRLSNYRELKKNGWTIMTPEYEIAKGKIKPTRTLKRGIPDSKINRRFVREQFLEQQR